MFPSIRPSLRRSNSAPAVSTRRHRTRGMGFSRAWVEYLEDRLLFAIRVWSGLGVDANWSTAANWAGGVAPTSDDNLVFPAGASQLSNFNDLANNTRFRSITISDPGYNISEAGGGPHGIGVLEGFVYNATASGASFSV